MPKKGRYSMPVKGMGPQNADLLECLLRVDREQSLDQRSAGLVDRLLAGGLLDREEGRLILTAAGIERCRSLQHRVESDKQAGMVLASRAADEDAAAGEGNAGS